VPRMQGSGAATDAGVFFLATDEHGCARINRKGGAG